MKKLYFTLFIAMLFTVIAHAQTNTNPLEVSCTPEQLISFTLHKTAEADQGELIIKPENSGVAIFQEEVEIHKDEAFYEINCGQWKPGKYTAFLKTEHQTFSTTFEVKQH